MTAAADALPAEPWWGNHFGETRWILEATRLSVDPAFLGLRGIPRGDRRAVVLMPGFLAGDQTLAVMATWLYRIGYRPHICGFIANLDCSERALQRVERRVAALHRKTGRRVALIGHSRGGHYAKALGARRPEHVSHAISLGADLQALLGVSLPTQKAVEVAAGALRRTGRARHPDCLTINCPCAFAAAYGTPFPSEQVRLTSIYSKGDGVVRWEKQIIPEADCVEVTGSHVGLIFNRKAYRVIAQALAAPELST